MASKYAPIWDALKSNGVCKVAAHIALHPRIIKAVINVKFRDEGYRLKMSEKRLRIKMWYSRDHSMIRFWLRSYDNLSNISLEELGISGAEFTELPEASIPVINVTDGGNIV